MSMGFQNHSRRISQHGNQNQAYGAGVPASKSAEVGTTYSGNVGYVPPAQHSPRMQTSEWEGDGQPSNREVSHEQGENQNFQANSVGYRQNQRNGQVYHNNHNFNRDGNDSFYTNRNNNFPRNSRINHIQAGGWNNQCSRQRPYWISVHV